MNSCMFPIFFLSLASGIYSLKCYQTNKETKEMIIVEDDEYVLCSVFPFIRDSRHLVDSVADGLKAEEMDKPFDKFFEDNDHIYSMLSTCMFERYGWPKVWSPKFNSARQVPEVEYTLRCVCNTNLCNSPNSFSSHIHQLMESH
uniref:Uncharacterized protein n=1 Tax=Acrobeloides nanus TaxID=290746 RepID=A0A914D4I5_9BILA